MPQHVIDRVGAQAYCQGMKPLSFHNRERQEFMPAGMPAGVAGTQGNETLLKQLRRNPRRAVRQQNFVLDTVDEYGEDYDDESSLPDLMDGPLSDYDYSSSEEEDSDDEDDMGFRGISVRVQESPGMPPEPETRAPETIPIIETEPTFEGPKKAPKLPTVGWRRSARIAAQKKSLQQRILPPRKSPSSTVDLQDDDPYNAMATVNGTGPFTPKRAVKNKWYDTINSETSSCQKMVQVHLARCFLHQESQRIYFRESPEED